MKDNILVLQKENNRFFHHYEKFRFIRSDFIPDLTFENPLWAVIYQIYQSEVEGRILYASNIGFLAKIPQTTALRSIETLNERDLVWRIRNKSDKRMVRVCLSPQLKKKMDELFFEVSRKELV